jgi:hypothetical protein
MKKDSLEQFWQEKEKQRKSKLILASSAQYLGGYPGLAGPINGLLYIMTDGVYFENFKNEDWWRGVLRDVFHVDEDFAKTDLALPKKDITEVYCFPGQKDKRRMSVWRRIGYLVGLTPRRIYVACRRGRGEMTLAFACDEPPLSLCAAFYGDRKRLSRLAAGRKKR